VSPIEIMAYSRQQTQGGESGRLDYMPQISSPDGIIDWQPADGGLYYLTADGTLRFLRGARGSNP
jgi:hypothetical protein